MKIRIISNGIIPDDLGSGVGGAIRMQIEIAKILGKNNEVQLIGRSERCGYAKKTRFGEVIGVRPWDKFKAGKKDFSYLLPLLFATLKKKCDILHANTNPYLLYLPRARKRILHLHMSAADMIGIPSYQKALSKADVIICCSKFVQREILGNTDFSHDKIRVIYNGVNLGLLKGAGERRKIRILYAGQINEEKGLEHLIEAFKMISMDFPDAELLVAGSASIWPNLDKKKFELDKKYEVELKKKAKGEKIKFLGKLQVRDLYKLYKKCSIFVLPSVVQEALPVVVIEAMASGMPIVASDVGGVPELVHNGKTGFLTKPGDPEELAKALTKLLSNKKLRENMGKRSSIYAEEFSIEKMAGQIYRIYEEILEK